MKGIDVLVGFYIFSQLEKIMATTAETKQLVQDMRSEVAAQTTKIGSLNAFVETMFAQIKELLARPDVPDEVKADIEALRAEITAQAPALDEAFTENTPAAGVPINPV